MEYPAGPLQGKQGDPSTAPARCYPSRCPTLSEPSKRCINDDADPIFHVRFRTFYPRIAEPCWKMAPDDDDQFPVVCQEPSLIGEKHFSLASFRPWNTARITQERHRFSIDIVFHLNVMGIRVEYHLRFPSPCQDDDSTTRRLPLP